MLISLLLQHFHLSENSLKPESSNVFHISIVSIQSMSLLCSKSFLLSLVPLSTPAPSLIPQNFTPSLPGTFQSLSFCKILCQIHYPGLQKAWWKVQVVPLQQEKKDTCIHKVLFPSSILPGNSHASVGLRTVQWRRDNCTCVTPPSH